MKNEVVGLPALRSGPVGRAFVAVFACCSMLAGCGEKSAESPSQVVASVGGQEVTESQVNHALERQPAFKPDQADAVTRKVITGLVEQEIVLQKARDLKIDRDQQVVQNIEATKREIVARAYLDRIAEGAAKPTPNEVQAYYDENPALFKQRRIYTFQELAVEATDAQRKDIEAQMVALKSPAELEAFLKARQMPVRSSRSTVTAENVPLPLLQKVSTLQQGQGLILPANGGVRILLLLGAQDSPVGEEQARAAISTFLMNQRKRQVVEKELGSLRVATKVQYFGKYADMAASAAAPTASAPVASLQSPSGSVAGTPAVAPVQTDPK